MPDVSPTRSAASLPPAGKLTVPDLVLLSFLSERPMHGYELVHELDRREVPDWAEVSRPHVYYAMRKLAAAGLIARLPDDGRRAVPTDRAAGVRGPSRRVYAVTEAGRRIYAEELARPDWSIGRPPPAFRTWWVLAAQATPKLRAAQIARRRAFLEGEIVRERATLRELEHFAEPAAEVGRQIVDLAIRQFETELRWLDDMTLRERPTAPT